MAEKTLAAYEQRALEAEKHISILTKKLEEIEYKYSHHANDHAEAQRQAHAVATEVKGGETSGDIIEITKSRDEAVKDNKQLKLQIEKLNYRILHLKQSLEEEEKKNKQ